MTYHVELHGRASRRPRIRPMGDDGMFAYTLPPPVMPTLPMLGSDAEALELLSMVPITPFLLGDTTAPATGLTDDQKMALKALLGLITVIALAWFTMEAFKKKQVTSNAHGSVPRSKASINTEKRWLGRQVRWLSGDFTGRVVAVAGTGSKARVEVESASGSRWIWVDEVAEVKSRRDRT